VGAGHHQMYATAPSMMAGVASHLQLGPRQLDFGVLPTQAWQACSPLDGTPSAMCAMSPITPAPRMRPVLGGRQQTVYEVETPDRPQQPQYHAFGQQQFMCEESKACLRHPSPRHQENRAPTTPPRTPTRKFLMEMADDQSSAWAEPNSVERRRSPQSIAKTPSYGMWVQSTPSPQPNIYRGTQAQVLADLTNTSAYVEARPQFVADMPPMLPQQLQYSMHYATPWGVFPGAC